VRTSINFNNIITISLQDENSCKQVNSTLRQTSDETKHDTRDADDGSPENKQLK